MVKSLKEDIAHIRGGKMEVKNLSVWDILVNFASVVPIWQEEEHFY